VIVLSGSVAEVPASLLAQLKVGGRLSPSSATSR
jgi:protein-L-isoaspartate O-methyltransferase